MTDFTDQAEKDAFIRSVNMRRERPQTNGDRIRAMGDEELAKVIGENVLCSECPVFVGRSCGKSPSECHQVWLDWLRKEANDGND